MKSVVIGVGSEFRGDDRIGLEVVKKLKKEVRNQNVMFIKTQVPENFFKKIKDFKPNKLIIIDSADFGGKPGEFRIIDKNSIKENFSSTHNLPLTIFLKEVNCKKIVFIAVQYKNIKFGSRMSKDVKNSLEKITNFVKKII
jgi:hydrogenase 3 maturation protease